MSPFPDPPLRVNLMNETESSQPQATAHGVSLPGVGVFLPRSGRSGHADELRLTDAEVDRIAEKVAERVFLALDRRDEAQRLMAQFHVGDR